MSGCHWLNLSSIAAWFVVEPHPNWRWCPLVSCTSTWFWNHLKSFEIPWLYTTIQHYYIIYIQLPFFSPVTPVLHKATGTTGTTGTVATRRRPRGPRGARVPALHFPPTQPANESPSGGRGARFLGNGEIMGYRMKIWNSSSITSCDFIWFYMILYDFIFTVQAINGGGSVHRWGYQINIAGNGNFPISS
jgi:hypothetical protein